MTTETVTGRSIPRATGSEPVHDLRVYGPTAAARPHPAYRDRCVIVECAPCNWEAVIDGGHTLADLARLGRQHAGTEDP